MSTAATSSDTPPPAKRLRIDTDGYVETQRAPLTVGDVLLLQDMLVGMEENDFSKVATCLGALGYAVDAEEALLADAADADSVPTAVNRNIGPAAVNQAPAVEVVLPPYLADVQ